MSRRLIIVDFDRTLFNVNLFFTDFCELILSDSGIKNHDLRSEVEGFLSSGAHSDFKPFMDRYHVDLQGVVGKVNYTLSHKSYLYDDVDEFLSKFADDQVVVLSTGRQEFQQIKFQLAGEFSNLIKIVIPGNKAEYLNEQVKFSKDYIMFPKATGKRKFSELYLIDDRVDMIEELAGKPRTKLFQIERPDAKYTRKDDHAGIKHITSLEDVN